MGVNAVGKMPAPITQTGCRRQQKHNTNTLTLSRVWIMDVCVKCCGIP